MASALAFVSGSQGVQGAVISCWWHARAIQYGHHRWIACMMLPVHGSHWGQAVWAGRAAWPGSHGAVLTGSLTGSVGTRTRACCSRLTIEDGHRLSSSCLIKTGRHTGGCSIWEWCRPRDTRDDDEEEEEDQVEGPPCNGLACLTPLLMHPCCLALLMPSSTGFLNQALQWVMKS